MHTLPLLRKEFKEEAEITRKFLAILPGDQWEFKPHEKSMKLQNLVTHIAELPGWAKMAVDTDGLDFAAQPYVPAEVNTPQDVRDIFEKSVLAGHAALQNAGEEILELPWILSQGDIVLANMNKYETIRHCLNQTTHHRAQLGVYYRLLGIPVPGSYGPSADDQNT